MSSPPPPKYSRPSEAQPIPPFRPAVQVSVTFLTVKSRYAPFDPTESMDTVLMANTNATVEEVAETAIERFAPELSHVDFRETYVYREYEIRVDKTANYLDIFHDSQKMIISNHPRIYDYVRDRESKDISFVIGVVLLVIVLFLLSIALCGWIFDW